MRPGISLLTILLTLLVAACGNNAADNTPKASRNTPLILANGTSVFRRGNGAEPETLDPHRAQSVTSSNILRDIYEGLVNESPEGELIPGGAERWEISEDGKTYTFYLRKDARWSNGEPVTARDYVYGLRRCVDPKTGSVYAEILTPINNARAIISGELPPEALDATAINDYQLEIHLQSPTPYFLGLLTHSSAYPAHQASIEKHGDQFTQPGNHISNGAYQMSEWVVASHITITRNTHYWDNANTQIDAVKYIPIENAESEFKRYLSGELDMTASLPIPQIEWAKENLPDDYQSYPSLAVYYYGLNLTRPPFKDNPKLRRALSLAIDRQIITEKVTRGGQIPAYSWVPPGVHNYEAQDADYAAWPKEKQLAEARRLYKEAGYSEENPLEVELRYNTSEGHKKIATAIASMWKTALGAKVVMVNEEWKVFLQNVNTKKVTQVYRSGWVGDYNDANTFLELMHSAFGLNGTGYTNPEYDRLLDMASRESDVDKRRRLMQQAEQLLISDQPVIPVYHYVGTRLVKPYLKGFVGNIMGHFYSKHFRIEPGNKTGSAETPAMQ